MVVRCARPVRQMKSRNEVAQVLKYHSMNIEAGRKPFGCKALGSQGQWRWNCSRALIGLKQTPGNGPGTRVQYITSYPLWGGTGASVRDLTVLRLGWDESHANSRTQRSGCELPITGSRSKVSGACMHGFDPPSLQELTALSAGYQRPQQIRASPIIAILVLRSTAEAFTLQLISLRPNLCSGCKSARVEEKHETNYREKWRTLGTTDNAIISSWVVKRGEMRLKGRFMTPWSDKGETKMGACIRAIVWRQLFVVKLTHHDAFIIRRDGYHQVYSPPTHGYKTGHSTFHLEITMRRFATAAKINLHSSTSYVRNSTEYILAETTIPNTFTPPQPARNVINLNRNSVHH